ncbi:hypothetical protein, partial [Desulfocicer niacini]
QEIAAKKRAAEINQVIKKIALKEAMEAETSDTPPAPPITTPPEKCMGKPLMIAGICFILVIAMIVISSFNNSNRYYIKDTFQGMEIWKGDFAPVSKHKIAFLEGIDFTGEKKASYNSKEVFPVAFFHYINLAEEILNAKGTVNLAKLRATIDTAASFATDDRDAEILNEFRALFFQAADKSNHGVKEKAVAKSEEKRSEVTAHDQSTEESVDAQETIAPESHEEEADSAVQAESPHDTSSHS